MASQVLVCIDLKEDLPRKTWNPRRICIFSVVFNALGWNPCFSGVGGISLEIALIQCVGYVLLSVEVYLR